MSTDSLATIESATKTAVKNSALIGDVVENVSPKYLGAVNALATGKIPNHAIKSHVGKGGKVFEYIAHWWVTEQLNLALSNLWSMDVGEPKLHPDGSATVPVKLILFIPLKDGEFFRREIAEIGAFEGNKGMSEAHRIASAASRGLVRCVFRAFGLGQEFYLEEEDEDTPEQAWTFLLGYAQSKLNPSRHPETNNKIENDVKELLKALGFPFKELVEPENYKQAYKMIAKYVESQRLADVPSDLKNHNGSKPAISEKKVVDAPKQERRDPEKIVEELGFSPQEPEPTPASIPEPAAASEENVSVPQDDGPPWEDEAEEQPVMLADPKLKFENWKAVSAKLALLGIKSEDVVPILKDKFGGFNPKRINEYWTHIATLINTGELKANPVPA